MHAHFRAAVEHTFSLKVVRATVSGAEHLPDPDQRVVLLRLVSPQPSVHSRPLVHRMLAIEQGGDLRIADAIATDGMYH